MPEWTTKEDELLRDMAADGWSYAEAGAVLGRTRNAVAGHAFRTGVVFHGTLGARVPNPQRGGENYSARLTENAVRSLRTARAENGGRLPVGMASVFAKAYKVSKSAIFAAAAGRRWRHVS